ncbi:hypothetical protein DZK27_09750 [Rhodobacteraceae bacterium 63075]|nr:hypothetical protein DZK27_09750 [Rhodobacteraceae bacterium 63075]
MIDAIIDELTNTFSVTPAPIAFARLVLAIILAGLIFTSNGEVRNITTGASLWLAGAIGLGCGAGKIPLAAMAAVTAVVVLYVLRLVEEAAGTQ